MKKLILTVLICMALALMPIAHAAMPSVSVTITPIDYLYAQAGIAQPVSKNYVTNERYALLVVVSVPNYMDVSGMSAKIEPYGCTVETGAVPIVSGQYILTGTILGGSASVKVTLQDDRIGMAGTAQELWQAMYGDRTVTASYSFSGGSASFVPVGSATIPQTGEVSMLGYAAIFFAGASFYLSKRRSK